MNTASSSRPFIPVPTLIAAVVGILLLVAAGVYLSRPESRLPGGQPSQEARAYVSHLQLSNVTMQATENFMDQRVVEVQGNIANQGSRPLRSVSVYCLFQGIDGREIGRERLPIVPATGTVLKPGEVRRFRLPFDTLPEGWNQAMPRMVIAQIGFAE